MTTVKCDNPKCAAIYDVPSYLGGHTFTCNQCGSKVTVRDLSFIGSQPLNFKAKLHPSRRVKTPLLNKMLAKQEWLPTSRRLVKVIANYWLIVLFVAVFGTLLAISHC